MTALGVSLIVIGVALICGGLILRPRASRTDPEGPNGPGELRALINALEEEEKAERGAMANVRPRLDKIGDKDSSK